jgi:SGNH hydrolase-like domain, acetyltransferase AlgX
MQTSSLAATLPGERHGGPTDPSHDDLLRRGIIRTDVRRSVAWLLVGLFLGAIYLVPLSQAYLEHSQGDDSPLLDLFRHKPSAENLHQFEKDIEQASYAKAYTQPRLQAWLTHFGRVGNKLAFVGKRGWLYYKPGVLHVVGPGFLEPDVRRSRERDALDAGNEAIVADPRPAIVSFHAALAARGIRLVVVPVPDKAALAGEPLHGRGSPQRRPENPDFQRLVSDLRGRGVAVFDPGQGLVSDQSLYLAQDTHWTPAYMEHTARGLARYVTTVASLPAPNAEVAWHAAEQPMARVGDLVDMLKLNEDQTVFQPQSVVVHQVRDTQDEPWESDEKADVLLLGDSFSNIFSLEGMGWGSAAGLGPQLALAMRRPVDVLAQNDAGAFATRRALARELASGADRLQGKRVVIWEFASRELSAGDWKQVDWSNPASSEGRQ